MNVLINTSESGIIQLTFLPDGTTVTVTERSTGLLKALVNFLEPHGAALSALTGLAVVVGAGRFTATRIATVVGNTLAYALQIPIVAVSTPDTANANAALARAMPGQYILPVYSGGAHISGRA